MAQRTGRSARGQTAAPFSDPRLPTQGNKAPGPTADRRTAFAGVSALSLGKAGVLCGGGGVGHTACKAGGREIASWTFFASFPREEQPNQGQTDPKWTGAGEGVGRIGGRSSPPPNTLRAAAGLDRKRQEGPCLPATEDSSASFPALKKKERFFAERNGKKGGRRERETFKFPLA